MDRLGSSSVAKSRTNGRIHALFSGVAGAPPSRSAPQARDQSTTSAPEVLRVVAATGVVWSAGDAATGSDVVLLVVTGTSGGALVDTTAGAADSDAALDTGADALAGASATLADGMATDGMNPCRWL